MKIIASGEFAVNLAPLDPYIDGSEGLSIRRMSIEKTYHGDLQATSRGEMLTVLTTVEGSASYVAIEQVRGVLEGKSGSFVLAHFGSMSRGENRLILEVVPNSGSGQLANVYGSMTINVKDGKHSYKFEYSLEAVSE